MANDNKSTDEPLRPQDQRPYSARLFLVIVAVILIVIGIGFFMMLFTQCKPPQSTKKTLSAPNGKRRSAVLSTLKWSR